MRGLVPDMAMRMPEAEHSVPSRPAATAQPCCLALVPTMAPALAAAPKTGPVLKGHNSLKTKLRFKLTKMLRLGLVGTKPHSLCQVMAMEPDLALMASLLPSWELRL